MQAIKRHLAAHARVKVKRALDRALDQAPVLDIDDSSRLVFFSDLHRGDNGAADAFRPNRTIFERALRHYEREGYTYVEVGDGDELWKNRSLADVRLAHAPVYTVMERLRRAGRLLVLVGNHQLVGRRRQAGVEALSGAIEAIQLRHRERAGRFLVTHGHQADGLLTRIYGLTRPLVRHFWRHLQRLGMRTALPHPEDRGGATGAMRGAIALSDRNQIGIEQRIATWLECAGVGIICGHTHRPSFAAAGQLPYYNTGCGTQPGTITGLEIADGAISLVSWTNRRKDGPGALSLAGEIRRVVLEGPLALAALWPVCAIA